MFKIVSYDLTILSYKVYEKNIMYKISFRKEASFVLNKLGWVSLIKVSF